MLRDFFDLIKELLEKFFNSRILILGVINAVLVGIIVARLYSLQIVHGSEYLDDYISLTEKTVSTDPSRGRIYDRKGNLLAYNELTYNVIIQDNGDYQKTNEKNLMLYRLVCILLKNGEKVEGNMQIAVDSAGEYVYTTSGEKARKSFLRDIYGLKYLNELDDEKGKYPTNVTAQQIVEMKAKDYQLDKLKDASGNLIVPSNEEMLGMLNIRYSMSLSAYRKYEEITVASDVKEKTRIQIKENAGDLLGVDVREGTKRVYNDAVYFSSLVGYIGRVQEEQLIELQAVDPGYTMNDIVGRTGIEQYMENELHGKKGHKTMNVDNVGHILDVIEETDPVAGNDIYLTIDRDMQIGIYNLLERQLAGVLISKIVNEDDPNKDIDDASDFLIPVKDAYYQLIGNNVIDINHFRANDASATEKEIYEKFDEYKNRNIDIIRKELTGDYPKNLSELPEDINAFMVYIYNKLVADEVIFEDIIDQNSDYYKRWKADSISMRDYLYSGIANNWLDSSVLGVKNKYSDADDIFLALVDYIEHGLVDDKEYFKLNYKYMVRQNLLSGRELCICLFDQGILKMNKDEYNSLVNGDSQVTYDFLMEKIADIEITPAQLALDPCTAGCVITDVNTGEIRAIVSYPGYDNNKLTGSMDVAYYNSLLADQSLPLYNNATQAKKAPGSTFKPITAIAALEEGKIQPGETIQCTGIYTDINPPIRCWIYPGAHGDQEIVGGIRNSCNFFFSELGHRLATDEAGSYSTELGINTLAKYAECFGLGHKSGVEMQETEPSISTTSPEQSAMGQGTHSFANVQLSRYVSAIANKGTVFELSVLDKLTDSEGNLIKDYGPDVYSTLSFNDETWNLVQEGMHEVTTIGSAGQIFQDLEFSIAGKTGTAQESKARANHAFFISFAPYENPEIAVTVNIPYGYSSSNAATVARNVYRFYFGYLTLDEILTGGAFNTYDVEIGD